MRKGAWLNRPVVIHTNAATNKHDADIARAKAIAEAIVSISMRGFNLNSYLNDTIRVIGETVNEK